MLLGDSQTDFSKMSSLKYDSSHSPVETSPFYASFPPHPSFMHPAFSQIYGRGVSFLEEKFKREDPHLYSPSDRTKSDLPLPPPLCLPSSEHAKMLELDLTHGQYRVSERHSPLSPSEYYRRRDILSTGSSSHSSPTSSHSGELNLSRHHRGQKSVSEGGSCEVRILMSGKCCRSSTNASSFASFIHCITNSGHRKMFICYLLRNDNDFRGSVTFIILLFLTKKCSFELISVE